VGRAIWVEVYFRTLTIRKVFTKSKTLIGVVVQPASETVYCGPLRTLHKLIGPILAVKVLILYSRSIKTFFPEFDHAAFEK